MLAIDVTRVIPVVIAELSVRGDEAVGEEGDARQSHVVSLNKHRHDLQIGFARVVQEAADAAEPSHVHSEGVSAALCLQNDLITQMRTSHAPLALTSRQMVLVPASALTMRMLLLLLFRCTSAVGGHAIADDNDRG